MFYVVEVEDHVRVEPDLFGLETREAVRQQLKKIYSEHVSKELGTTLGVLDVMDIDEGIIIFGDGAVYYKSLFKVLTWKPEMQEICFGTVESIESFGAIINLGLMQGMAHVSQTMEDFVSFSKANSLVGKNTKRILKKGDSVLARIVALSQRYDDMKIGLTMRQPGLGRLEWIEEDKRKSKMLAKKAEKAEAATTKKGKKK
jgi:DNA-directed RNA polymerase subunit E'